MPLKKQSSTTRPRRGRRKTRFFLDRNLGRNFFPAQLRKAGLDVIAQDDTEEFSQTERDPWMFYKCGKKDMVVVTSDLKFRKSFPHMAAVALGNTTIISFTGKTYNSDARGNAFLAAIDQIRAEIADHRRAKKNFIAVVGAQGSFRVVEEKPLPYRTTCDQRDWDSYQRVCSFEGVLAFTIDEPKRTSRYAPQEHSSSPHPA